MGRRIVIAPDERLNRKCKQCDIADKTLVALARDMTRIMYDSSGVGIAAPQVGDDRRLIVVDVDYDSEDKSTRDPLIMLNPEIIDTWGENVEDTEGCLSFPGISVPITRPEFAKVAFTDLDGDEWEIEGDGLLARCLQHEIDHLNGITLFESCLPDVRLQAMADFAKAKAKGARPGDASA